ncbi:hypothetical protein M427DRAFT_146474 [Gonapodya prolifera JEL478]|uniref:Uncharacterized protein n=1 Tax=Gonapodya prolifera (strain JEL478) TaxID=1344416 RepID=A0A139AA90_GONPJ|nr:hypothetical protein M427DRAFT_146474 [Gonapodya prolifera JEL478]|eukprot:KXS13647.1 hypothetical protein M427DRAFT_146474 [Gonapodya prolifera JEL478]
MTSLVARVQPVVEGAVATAGEIGKKYIPEPYYTQGSEAAKSAITAAEKYAQGSYEAYQKTRADVEKKVTETRDLAVKTAQDSYATYVPTPVKQTVESTLATATQAREVAAKRVEGAQKAALDAQKFTLQKVDETKQFAISKAAEAQQVVTAKATEASQSAYKVAEPYIIPVQHKIVDLIKEYKLDERVTTIVKEYKLDQRAAEIVTFLEHRGIPVPKAVKEYLPIVSQPEEPKVTNGAH